MNQIKFRGISVETGKIVYGMLIQGENYYIITTKQMYSAVISLGIRNNYHASVGCIEVNPETVGQFTGLYDKEGREIYEGDIVTFKTIRFNGNEYDTIKPTKEVRYDSDMLLIPFHDNSCEEIEIIGNKFDNPELKQEEL